jgi:5-methylcytosine-specific restriction endonuclease McrA
MAVIRPRIRQKKVRPAINILRSMSNLLQARFELEITRREFLKKWARFRRELQKTPEYKRFRDAVYNRDGGLCQRCGNPGSIVHHLRQVSFAPQHALDPKNGELQCRDCHTEEHPWLRNRDAVKDRKAS